MEEEIVQPPRRRGRPAKDETSPPGTIINRAYFTPSRRLDDELERERRWQSTFILISNDESRSAKERFLAYRGQVQVESAFRWLKRPVRVSPVSLKKETRVQEFGYVMLMACLVYALVQRAIHRVVHRRETRGGGTQDRPPHGTADPRRHRPRQSAPRSCPGRAPPTNLPRTVRQDPPQHGTP